MPCVRHAQTMTTRRTETTRIGFLPSNDPGGQPAGVLLDVTYRPEIPDLPQRRTRPTALEGSWEIYAEEQEAPQSCCEKRWEKRQQQEPPHPLLQVSLPALRSPELNEVLAAREGWELDTGLAETTDPWIYHPSIPEGWDESYDGGGTSITPTEDGGFEVVPPSFDDHVSEFQSTYGSVSDLLQDIEAIEHWRHPVSGPPPGDLS